MSSWQVDQKLKQLGARIIFHIGDSSNAELGIHCRAFTRVNDPFLSAWTCSYFGPESAFAVGLSAMSCTSIEASSSST